MTDTNTVTGHITPTAPASSALDTLKALVLRNIDQLDYITDRLAGGAANIPEDDLEFLDYIRQNQYKALAEHVHVAKNELLSELRHPHPDAYQYDDGTPVVEHFKSKYGQSTYFTRYDGPREDAIQRHEEWVRQVESNVEAEMKFGEIIEGIDWGHDGPSNS